MNTFLFKLIGGAVIMAMLGGAAWYIKNLIAENAVLEATVKHQTLEVEGYTTALSIVSEKFQIADKVQSDAYKKISQADFDAMAKRHPDMLERRINNGTARLFESLQSLSGGTPPRSGTKTNDNASG